MGDVNSYDRNINYFRDLFGFTVEIVPTNPEHEFNESVGGPYYCRCRNSNPLTAGQVAARSRYLHRDVSKYLRDNGGADFLSTYFFATIDRSRTIQAIEQTLKVVCEGFEYQEQNGGIREHKVKFGFKNADRNAPDFDSLKDMGFERDPANANTITIEIGALKSAQAKLDAKAAGTHSIGLEVQSPDSL
jgi:hypothetical protein